ncbi:MAG: DUF4149 domain-containing protein [Polaromonas sp.]|nr:DUF4149 domain-containing protein [Polaromonas sp.]
MKPRFVVLLSALWWGSLSGLGFIVVPLLFTHLGSPAEAGAMAAKLFTAQTWLSVVCAMLLLMLLNKRDDVEVVPESRNAMAWVVAGMLLALLVEFGVAAQIVSARSTGGNLRLWHGLGSAMYFGQWLCASWLLWRLSRFTAR